ncbi:MAG: hypothetical protein HeimC3_10070 [Candidatus Heimdallarchaeota archaeon LC_3]|nr:MAG: hypothetical protein HeimC3_10070 [Candidatus Heimdallarchaeota archaeon LC_3]
MVPTQEIPKNWSLPDKKGKMEIFGFALFGVIINDLLYPQGGINEKGLCFDINGLPTVKFNGQKGSKWHSWFNWFDVLWNNRTVADIEKWFQIREIPAMSWNGGQFHFADSNGNAIIIGVGGDGNLAFTKKKSNNFLVSTNNNIANVENGYYPCTRYDKTVTMLEKIINERNLTVSACRDILDAVHFEKRGVCETVYGNIFDLISKDIYVYSSHDFDRVVKFSLTEELRNPTLKAKQIKMKILDENAYGYPGFEGIKIYPIPDLFT